MDRGRVTYWIPCGIFERIPYGYVPNHVYRQQWREEGPHEGGIRAVRVEDSEEIMYVFVHVSLSSKSLWNSLEDVFPDMGKSDRPRTH